MKMKTVLLLTSCLALVGMAQADPQDPQDQQHKKKNAGQGQQQQQLVNPNKHNKQGGKKGGQGNDAGQINAAGPGNKGKHHKNQDNNLPDGQTNASGQINAGGKHNGGKNQNNNPANNQANAMHSEKFQAKHFDLKTEPKPDIQAMKFQQGQHIQGSQNWNGQKYVVFRNYNSQWHDQGWWNSHYSRISFVFGAPYYWNAGYWYPAWGYNPAAAYYPYDGPIYAYNDLPPDQVIANVQAALQAQGYYQGEVDGLLGPLTRAALASYQRDRGLYETAAIDEPTLSSLGMS
jgi:Putative peptidoglycan binding domain